MYKKYVTIKYIDFHFMLLVRYLMKTIFDD